MREKFYDGRKLFEWWCDAGKAGTNESLRKFAKATMPNPETGEVSRMGPTYAMWAWAFENAQEAYEMWKRREFLLHPHIIGTFNDFLIVLRDRGLNNPNIAGGKRVTRFCQQNGIPIKFNVDQDDVIQVTKTTHPLYQRFLIVNRSHDEGVEAIFLGEDGNHSSHYLPRDYFGVVGKSLVGVRKYYKGANSGLRETEPDQETV
jgi:hypothetical protein